MSLVKIKKYNLNIDFFGTRSIYPFYSNVYNKSNHQNFLNPNQNNSLELGSTIHVVNYINPYLQLSLNDSKISLKAFKFQLHIGFLANLHGFSNVDEYMKFKMSSKGRTKMRGYLRRLETCFNIHYKMYYGNITIADYELLFRKLHCFILNRFEERGNKHEALENWEILKKNSYAMILDKKASLFVIYNGEEPIDICLNYHHQNILDNAIRSYDINYSKFRLGYIDILKQLEWCFENGAEIFDLSFGDFEYKRKWCNEVYDFETQIIYNKSRFEYKAIAFGIMQLNKLKAHLKKKNVHLVYHKARKLFNRKIEVDTNKSKILFDVTEIETIPKMETLSQIDIRSDKYEFIKRPVYDFQYLNFETSQNIKVYNPINFPEVFIISGKKKCLKIELL
ncbi:GNAT family N-acetyltransferase [Flavobacteriaceae bacterium KMM 6898]|nr:GNAT family N-acetyltransferase [Flavobacteriaceae bacterium KMM 6898]